MYRLATVWTIRGSNPDGGEIFSTRLDRPSGPPSHLYHGYHMTLGEKQPGRGVDHPPLHLAEVKERVEIHLQPRWTFVVCSIVIYCVCQYMDVSEVISISKLLHI